MICRIRTWFDLSLLSNQVKKKTSDFKPCAACCKPETRVPFQFLPLHYMAIGNSKNQFISLHPSNLISKLNIQDKLLTSNIASQIELKNPKQRLFLDRPEWTHRSMGWPNHFMTKAAYISGTTPNLDRSGRSLYLLFSFWVLFLTRLGFSWFWWQQ